MKNLVLKTALITLAVIIGVTAISFGIFAGFFPKTLGNFADQLGNYRVSVFYYQKAYDKSGDVNDLYDLVLKLDAKEDSADTAKYSLLLISRSDFEEFAKSKDGNNKITTKEFILAKYAISSYLAKEELITIKFCTEYVTANGYTQFNPYTMLISGAIDDIGVKGAETVMQELKAIKGNFVDNEIYLQNITNDILILENYINK